MNILRKKSYVTALALIFLMTSVAVLTVPIQPVKAQSELQVVTQSYLSFRPNPVGVDQTILINVWTTPPVNVYRDQSNYTVTLTKPDGTKDVITPIPYKGDSTAWFEYKVDQVGTWKIEFDYGGVHFPAATVPATTVSNGTLIPNYYMPSSTGEQTLIVQNESVVSWPMSTIPTDYWTRPISIENREWWIIAGNYPPTGLVGGGPNWPANTNPYMSNYAFVPYVQAPTSSHVIWRKQGAISGLVGGDTGINSITGGGGNPSIIYDGRCYQTITKPINGVSTNVWECYDLRTGQVYWDLTGIGSQAPTVISYNSSTTNVAAGLGSESTGPSVTLLYMGGGRLIKYDPWTGAVTVNESIPTTAYAPTLYNDPYAWVCQQLNGQEYFINFTTQGTATNFAQRIISNVSFALPVPQTSLYSPIRVADYQAGVGVYIGFEPSPNYGAWIGFNMSAASLTTGKLLWSETVSGDTQTINSPYTVCCDHGKIAVLSMDRFYGCYDLYTGKLLYKSEKADYPWGFGWGYATASAYGLLYYMSYAGVYAFDWNTGNIVWKFEAPTPYQYETPYTDANGTGIYSFDGACVIADGKLYTYNTEHTPTEPITRGWRTFCVNATTGQEIWNITGSMSIGAIADGYLIGSNSYDGYTYAFGRGQSKTTVAASPAVTTSGSTVLITGTVMDTSPGDQGTFQAPGTPLNSNSKAGTVPCVSDTSMTTQMEYLYMQKPIAGLAGNATLTGVPVTLTAIASDGTIINIGTTTTNGYYGTFSLGWTTPQADTYTITASFAGADSYGSSSAATAVNVGPTASVAPTPTVSTASNLATTSDLMSYIAVAAIAVIIAIAIVGAFTARMFSKRP